MRRSLALLASLLGGTKVAALDCAALDPVRTFQGFEAAGDEFAVLHGGITFDEALLPLEGPRDEQTLGASTDMPPIPALFGGVVLGPEEAGQPLSTTLLLQPVCLDQYCGSISEGTWVLFAEAAPSGYVVRIDICGGTVFEPDPRTLDALGACLRGEACEPADPPKLPED